jgi:CDP-diglyceride synthetase
VAGGELVRRWAVALVGIPIVVVVLYVGSWALAVAVAVIAVIATDEFYRLARSKGALPVAWLGIPTAAALVLLSGNAPTASAFASSALVLLGAALCSPWSRSPSFARPRALHSGPPPQRCSARSTEGWPSPWSLSCTRSPS